MIYLLKRSSERKSFHFNIVLNFTLDKKVLLRERKRHTDRGVSSTPSAVLYLGGGLPLPCQGVPHLGYPPSRPGWGVPHPGYPPLDLAGVLPHII